ncbi:MAG: GNAT family N-acetyltransferase [Hyphomicrobiales bacterium]
MTHLAADASPFAISGAIPRKAEAAREALLAPGQRLGLVGSLAGLKHLEAGWRALEADAATLPTVFQSYDWISTWCDTYCQGDEGVDLHILTGYAGSRLVFAMPLQLQARAGVRVLSWLTEPFGQYGDVLCARGEDLARWLNASFTYLGKLGSADLLRLRHVRADSAIAQVAGGKLFDAQLRERAPFLDLTAFANEEAYEARYTGNQRKRRKKIRKALEDMGPVQFSALSNGAGREAAIAEALAEKNKWLAGRGRINVAVGCPKHREFLTLLSRRSHGGDGMVLTELKAGERAVSWEISFRYRSKHFAYITSHVDALTDLSPGRLHFDLSQRACLADGVKTYDLMVPYDAHKESWSSGMVGVEDYYLPLTWRGRLAGHGYLRQLRPAVRRLYYRMPRSILRLLNPGKPPAPTGE